MPSAEEEFGLFREITERAKKLVPGPALQFGVVLQSPSSVVDGKEGERGERKDG